MAITPRAHAHIEHPPYSGSPASDQVTGRPLNGQKVGHGHWPLLIQVGAGEALKAGVAEAVSRVDGGGAAVSVPPTFIAVGLSDIAGTVGWVYTVVVAESPDPPATLRDVWSG
jgi:hypothetical protein